MLNNFDDIQKQSKENMEVTMQAFGNMSKGFQAIASEVADYQKKSFEEGSAAMEKMVACKSLDQAFEAQSEYFRSAYEGMVSQMTKLGEMYTDLSKEAYKPYEGMAPKAGK